MDYPRGKQKAKSVQPRCTLVIMWLGR
ncbi:MAG: hypothetical protein HGA75_14355 [Thiobacillus sp.]|nr:hypothetical protein [Thiobacillus sp.]